MIYSINARGNIIAATLTNVITNATRSQSLNIAIFENMLVVQRENLNFTKELSEAVYGNTDNMTDKKINNGSKALHRKLKIKQQKPNQKMVFALLLPLASCIIHIHIRFLHFHHEPQPDVSFRLCEL